MKRTNARRAGFGSQTGYSLIEVIVAISILVIGILATVPMLAFNVKANTSGGKFGYANYLATRKLEQIRSWPIYAGNSGLSTADTTGIGIANTKLFPSGATEAILSDNGIETYYITTTILRNGYDTLFSGGGDCAPYLFKTSPTTGKGYDESAGIASGTSLNTFTTGEYCSSGTRGEDFKIIRVRVQWNDNFGLHTIYRFQYIAGF
ncbi:MAG: prepilin-type N-terminal cleavage/methylation domain-containing protein [Myxococcales bacterium]|nr:prepilin-type N-terminal cleavage/methylation domain-containing protein [Myxococcales bacterium]